MQGSHRLDGMGAADGFRAGFRQSKMFDLAFLDQVPDGTGDFLDGHVRIDAVLVEQIDGLHPQPLERGFGDLLDMLGPAVQPRPAGATIRVELEPELCGDHHLPAERLQRFADQLFVGVGTIDFCCIEERDAAFHGCLQERDHLLPVSHRAVAEAHPHAAKPERRYFQTAVPKCTFLHIQLLSFLNSNGIREIIPSPPQQAVYHLESTPGLG